jgi:hypothetical protein
MHLMNNFELLPDHEAGEEALVERVASLKGELLVTLRLPDGRELSTALAPARAEQLELHEGQIVAIRATGAAAPLNALPRPPRRA